jgi:hypothetical protein
MKRSILVLIGCGLLALAAAAGYALGWFGSLDNDLSDERVRILYGEFLAGKQNEASSNVFLADLTHDGVDEMIVVSFFALDGKTPLPCHDGPAAMTGFGEASVTVYTLDEKENVQKLDRQSAASAHAGWLQLYLVKVDGSDYLFRYAPDMFQGYGEYSADVYALDGKGHAVTLFHKELSFTPDQMAQQAIQDEIKAFEQACQPYFTNALPLIVVFDDKFDFAVSTAADALKQGS